MSVCCHDLRHSTIMWISGLGRLCNLLCPLCVGGCLNDSRDKPVLTHLRCRCHLGTAVRASVLAYIASEFPYDQNAASPGTKIARRDRWKFARFLVSFQLLKHHELNT